MLWPASCSRAAARCTRCSTTRAQSCAAVSNMKVTSSRRARDERPRPRPRLLGNAGDDSGCDGALARLAEYVEGELTGRDMARILPAISEHLRNCPACAEDYQGLLALARERRGV